MRLADVRDWSLATRLAGGALVVALLIDVALLVRPRRADAVLPLTIRPVTRIAVRPLEHAELVREAAERSPFGGTPVVDVLAPAALLTQSTVPVVRPRLIGTVVESGGGFVVVELSDGRVQVVRIGDRVGDLRLRSVSAGMAVFDDPRDARITLRTSPPDSRP